MWRAVAVDAMDDQKIDEYLEKQGIRSMQDHGPKKPAPIKRKKPISRRKQFKKPRDNEHLADVLETYDDAKWVFFEFCKYVDLWPRLKEK